MNEEEVWKDVQNYEGLYQISNIGNIRATKHKNIPLKHHINHAGYYKIGLCKNGARKHHFLHRLVACNFIENTLKKSQVNHKNGIKTDNRVENLEWCTISENLLHAYKKGLKVPLPREQYVYMGHNNNCKKIVMQYDLNMNFIREWECAALAERELHISSTGICMVCSKYKKHSTAGGFIWKYKNI